MQTATGIAVAPAPAGFGVVATREELIGLLPSLGALPSLPSRRVQAPLRGSHPRASTGVPTGTADRSSCPVWVESAK